MPLLVRIWSSEAFAPSEAQPLVDELVLDRTRLGPDELTVPRADNAPRLTPLGDVAVHLSVPRATSTSLAPRRGAP